MDFTAPDFVYKDLESLSKFYKTRKTRLLRGTMSHKAYYAGIKKDLAIGFTFVFDACGSFTSLVVEG